MKRRLTPYLLLAFLGPVLWLQGRHARRTTPVLPEPVGPRQGRTGRGPRLRLLIAGDSAAAGVGARTQDEALCGQLLRNLGQHHTIEWQLMAVTGLDSPGLLKLIDEAPITRFDVVVLSIGANDATALCSPHQWIQWQHQLARKIQERFEPRLLIHTALPPMHGFTALPQPLRWFMGNWAHALNQALTLEVPQQGQRLMHAPFQGRAIGGLASDGFHPGPNAYALWARDLSQLILARLPAPWLTPSAPENVCSEL
jgi:lysophospholipase L1-like esterase